MSSMCQAGERSPGVPARRVATGAELDIALSEALSAGGVRVVVADAPDRQGEARLLEAVRAAAADGIAASRVGDPPSGP